jgi:DNA-binding NtrC family response regulator
MPKILIVDNEEKFCKVVKAALQLEQIDSEYVTSGEDAIKKLENSNLDIVVSDLRMDGMGGLELLNVIKKNYDEVEVIIMTAFASQKTALDALKNGAYDYLIKPFEMDELTLRINRIIEQKKLIEENKRLKEKKESPLFFEDFVGRSKKMQEVYRLIQKASENEATVLILGESGTGKELVANLIHKLSDRNGNEYVTVNCAALPENLLESELFGYEKGAFTGATQRRAGKFEQADSGSIFLDEIGDMSQSTQAKILRVLQNKEIYRLGGNEKIIVDVRIITATHQNLEKMVEEKKFRNDLYYRLNVFPITLPPLRDRMEDLPALANHFLKNTNAKGILRNALAQMMEYNWPGNIRELQNAVERASIICDGFIEIKNLPANILATTTRNTSSDSYSLPEKGIVLDEFEKDLILQALQMSNGNKSKAAELIGITRRRLYSMMERFDIPVK